MNENMLLDAIGEARPDFVEAARPAKKKKKAWTKIVAAAACICLCVCLAVPALAAANVQAVYEVLYAVSPSAAQRLKPVNLACEDEGIRMEVVSALVEGDQAEFLVSIRDLTGSRIDRTADLFDSYTINTPFGMNGTCRKTDYDEQTGAVFFLIELTSMDGKKIDGKKVTFSVREILYSKSRYDCLIELPPEESELCPVSEREDVVGGVWGFDDWDLTGVERIVPGGTETELVPGASLTGWRMEDGLFHVQIRYKNVHTTDNNGELYLLGGDGTKVNPLYGVYTRDGDDSLCDAVFDATAMDGRALWGSFTIGGGLVHGRWQVTIPLE